MPNLEDLLEKTSRTFALSIPLLEEPTRREVMIAYLLFRIADTFEDASHWPKDKRVQGLADFNRLLSGHDRTEANRLVARWVAEGVTPHAGYRELMAEVPFVLEAFFALGPEAVETIRTHVVRSADGMARFVSQTNDEGQLVLNDVNELREYCYVVAGIVGEMLTELFILGGPALASIAPYLRERARRFGEALQLVNILKDAASDAVEGRRYLPRDVPSSEIFALARQDLGAATEYILALQKSGSPRGTVAFTALPVELAWAALERVEKHGPGSKVSRPEVFLITQRVKRAVKRNEPAVRARSPVAAG
jgi:farnesyl-diphosphate farnesyltransferase